MATATKQPDMYDAVIVGGGPGGSVTALVMARAGLRVCVLEKARHPRFHIGQSILPRTVPLPRDLGLEDAVRKVPHVPKYGAEFGMGNDPNTMKVGFTGGLLPGFAVFNIERSNFDKLLLDKAREAGAEVLEDTTVKAITRLEDGHVEVKTADRTFAGR